MLNRKNTLTSSTRDNRTTQGGLPSLVRQGRSQSPVRQQERNSEGIIATFVDKIPNLTQYNQDNLAQDILHNGNPMSLADLKSMVDHLDSQKGLSEYRGLDNEKKKTIDCIINLNEKIKNIQARSNRSNPNLPRVQWDHHPEESLAVVRGMFLDGIRNQGVHYMVPSITVHVNRDTEKEHLESGVTALMKHINDNGALIIHDVDYGNEARILEQGFQKFEGQEGFFFKVKTPS
jgi:hypothetical protein